MCKIYCDGEYIMNRRNSIGWHWQQTLSLKKNGSAEVEKI